MAMIGWMAVGVGRWRCYMFFSYLVLWPREVEREELDSCQPMKTGAARSKQ
jgi:hypothetical protein